MTENFDKGWSLCFGDTRDLERGRKYFRKSINEGDARAMFYLGLTYEEEGQFDKAASYYLQGLEKRYILAAYRLAVLHGKAKVSDPDREFYLSTIKRLSEDRHWPSVARYTLERIFGSYGIGGVFSGVLAFVPNFFRTLLAAWKDPDADSALLRRW